MSLAKGKPFSQKPQTQTMITFLGLGLSIKLVPRKTAQDFLAIEPAVMKVPKTQFSGTFFFQSHLQAVLL